MPVRTSAIMVPKLPHYSWEHYTPKLLTLLRQGYGWNDFRHDALAGLTVAIVALPLAMALAIASGTTPDKGLTTAIVAGLVISLLGGSRVQIGGPTGAFVVVVFGIIQKFGYDGLVMATLIGGVMLLLAAAAGLGSYIRFIPDAVIKGFTAGIAAIIMTSQVGAFLGLSLAHEPGDVIGKWVAYAGALDTLQPMALAVGATALLIIIGMTRFLPKLPGFLVAVVVASAVAAALHLGVPTIGTKFHGIPDHLPWPSWPHAEWGRMMDLMPSAFTIALLAGIESLLSAKVADGMIKRQHRSNCELLAQGVANIASAWFGGLPATGAIARTATNIRAGARTPVAGIMHAVWLLVFMLFAAPLASYVPLPSLAAILFIVAWNMSEAKHLPEFWRHHKRERVVLLLTFILTMVADLTVAIGAGLVLAAIVKRLSRKPVVA
jgi:SulP family sulfate permease